MSCLVGITPNPASLGNDTGRGCVQKIKGRLIAIDWAVAKSEFETGPPPNAEGLGSPLFLINLDSAIPMAQLGDTGGSFLRLLS